MEDGRTIAGLLEQRVRTDIVEGELSPGSRLKLSGVRAERYGAGLIPLREALSRLTDRGFVTLQENAGFRVTPVSRKDLLDLTEARVGVECLALRRAVERGGVEWEARLIAALHRMERTQVYSDEDKRRTTKQWNEAHEEFHRALIIGCDSPRLLQYCSDLAEQSRRYRLLSISYAETPRKVEQEHRAIAAAALDHDADRLCREITQHYERTVDIISKSSALA